MRTFSLLLLMCLVICELVQARSATSDQIQIDTLDDDVKGRLQVETQDDDVIGETVCRPGKCRKCVKYEGQKVCIVATITTKDVIHLAIVTNNYTIVQGDVTAASHAPLCVKDIPGADIDELCINPYNVDMTHFTTCLNVTITQHNITFLAVNWCFQIPPKPTNNLAELLATLTEDNLQTDVTIDDPTCKPGECKICKTYQGQEVCLIATVTNADTVHLALVTSGYTLVEGDITASSHDPICVDNVPGTSIQQLCLNPSDVDMTNYKLCVDVSFKVNGRTYQEPVGCFQIPKPSFVNLAELVIPELRDTGANEEEDLYDFDLEDDAVIVADDGKMICHRGTCKICHHYRKMSACVVAKSTKRGMGLGLVVNHHLVLKGRLTDKSPICTRHVPRFPDVNSVCLVPSRVDTRRQFACVNVTAEVRDRKFNHSVGCFTIPRDDINALPELQNLFSAFMQSLITSGDATSGDGVISDDKKLDDETLRFEAH